MFGPVTKARRKGRAHASWADLVDALRVRRIAKVPKNSKMCGDLITVFRPEQLSIDCPFPCIDQPDYGSKDSRGRRWLCCQGLQERIHGCSITWLR